MSLGDSLHFTKDAPQKQLQGLINTGAASWLSSAACVSVPTVDIGWTRIPTVVWWEKSPEVDDQMRSVLIDQIIINNVLQMPW